MQRPNVPVSGVYAGPSDVEPRRTVTPGDPVCIAGPKRATGTCRTGPIGSGGCPAHNTGSG
jgi:hypothetical protein